MCSTFLIFYFKKVGLIEKLTEIGYFLLFLFIFVKFVLFLDQSDIS